MNNAAESPPPPPPAPAADPNPDDPDTTAVASSSPSPTPESPPSQKRKKHTELLATLLESLNSLIYIELSILYYLDCNFGLLLLRTLVQLFLLSARPVGLPHPSTRSALGAVLGSNLLCGIVHQVQARPAAGEATAFFLHGGILIDFIGQPGPTSKWSLLGLDLLVVGLQVVMLGVGIERRVLLRVPGEVVGGEEGHGGQDLEAEEAGLVRADATGWGAGGEGGMEMQDLGDEGTLLGGGGDGRRERANVHPLDEFYTGNVVLARLNVLETITRDVMNPTSGSEGVSGSAIGGGVWRLRMMDAA